MHRADQHTQQQIADLVEACAGYWELRGIALESSKEMQLELEQHLGKQKDKNIQESMIYSKPLRFGGKAWN